jgi:hypothetical protein
MKEGMAFVLVIPCKWAARRQPKNSHLRATLETCKLTEE